MPAASGASGGGGRGAGDVRAGGAWFEIYARDSLSPVLDKLKAKVTAFAGFMRKLGTGLLAGGGVLGAGPLAALFGGIERASKLEDLTDIFGLTAEAASKMSYAFEVAGVSTEELEKVFKELAKTNTTGKPLDEYLVDVADALLAIEDPSERARVAMEMLGRHGINFLRVAGDIRRLMDEAPIFSMEDLKNAEAVKQSWASIGIVLKSSLTSVFAVLAPGVKLLADWVRENKVLVGIAGAAALALVGLGVAALGVSLAVTGAVAAFTLLKGLILFLVTPIGVITAAAITLGVIFRDRLAEAFRETGEAFAQTWRGIADAVKAGDLQMAFEILATGIRLVWFTLIRDMSRAFADFIKENHRGLVTLAALFGGVVGGRAGLIGAGIGAGGAALAADELLTQAAREFGDTRGSDARIAELRRQLNLLTGRAAGLGGGGGGGGGPAALHQIALAAQGTFSGAASLRRFGIGEGVVVDTLKAINDGKGALPKEIGKEAGAALVGGLADFLRLK